MRNTRRNFMLSAAAGALLTQGRARAAKPLSTFPFSEFESRIARREFRDITKDILPTPAMIVDLDIFERNVRHDGRLREVRRHQRSTARQST